MRSTHLPLLAVSGLVALASARITPARSAAQHQRLARLRRQAVSDEPASLAEGSLTAEAGCQSFIVATAGATCDSVIASVDGLTVAAFSNANPSIACPGELVEGAGYCTQGPTATLQFGSTDLTRGCIHFYKAVEGDTCFSIAQQFSISTESFISQNPGVGPDCTTLWADAYVCVDSSGTVGTYDDSASPAVNAAVGPTPFPTATVSASGISSGSGSSGSSSGSAPAPPSPAFGSALSASSAASASRSSASASAASASAVAEAKEEAAERKEKAEAADRKAKAEAAERKEAAEEKARKQAAEARERKKAAEEKAAAARKARAKAQAAAKERVRVAAAKAEKQSNDDDPSSSSSSSGGGRKLSGLQVTFYGQGDGPVYCENTPGCTPNDDGMTVAAPEALFKQGKMCGKEVIINSVKLKVCDECPSQYCNSNHWDLTKGAARKIMGSDWHDIGLLGGLSGELIGDWS